jgi:hypothetical protein
LVARELAKIAGRIADVGDGKIADRWELQIERACSAGVGAVRCGASERRRFAQATSRDDHSVRALLTDASGALLEGEDSSMRHRPSSAKFAGASAHGFAFSPFHMPAMLAFQAEVSLRTVNRGALRVGGPRATGTRRAGAAAQLRNLLGTRRPGSGGIDSAVGVHVPPEERSHCPPLADGKIVN